MAVVSSIDPDITGPRWQFRVVGIDHVPITFEVSVPLVSTEREQFRFSFSPISAPCTCSSQWHLGQACDWLHRLVCL